MKHFFDEITEFGKALKVELLRGAKEELKRRPIKIGEMGTKMRVLCFNASAVDDYVPAGMEELLSVRSVSVEQRISDQFVRYVQRVVREEANEILAYIVANIQIKNIEGYLNLLFDLRKEFTFEANIVLHLPNSELIEYLKQFLDSSGIDRIPRKIEVYDAKRLTSWKTIETGEDLLSVDMETRSPIVLDRPFFSEIHLNVVKNHVPKVYNCSFGKLGTFLGHFGRKKGSGQALKPAKKALYLTWKDIAKFKLASSQSKTLVAVSYRGEIVSASRIMAKNINLNAISVEEIDFFRFRAGGQTLDVVPKDLTAMEINLDTQQVVFTHGVGEGENHISRYNRLVLFKGSETVRVGRLVPFERGASNFHVVQQFLGSRFAEYERARQLRKNREELTYLYGRNVVAGDLMSHLVLSNMKQLGILPMEVRCSGFEPEHVNNAPAVRSLFDRWFDELKATFADIIDLSDSPQFTKHNISRLTKQMRAFLEMRSLADTTSEIFLNLSKELENLIEYMDDFFRLNIYQEFTEDVESEATNERQTAKREPDPSDGYQRLDVDSRNFIGENFAFFWKRDAVQKAILKIERMLFYDRNIRPPAEKPGFEPDMLVYDSSRSLARNFRFAGYPSLSIGEIVGRQLLQGESEESDLLFVKFMRTFTQKVNDKASSLGKSFHHQYKNTLTELQFAASEKLRSLRDELTFLEDPANREQAYVQLLERIVKLYQRKLEEKRENIGSMQKELKEVEKKGEESREQLADLLKTPIRPDRMQSVLDSMPDRLERMRLDCLRSLEGKKVEISTLLLPISKFHSSVFHYYGKILNHAAMFQKALLVRGTHQNYLSVKEQSEELMRMGPDELAGLIGRLSEQKYDTEKEKRTLAVINKNTRKLKELLPALKASGLFGLFRKKLKEGENLAEYFGYFAGETKALVQRAERLASLHRQLGTLESTIFKQLKEITTARIHYSQNMLLLKTARLIRQTPGARDEVERLLKPSESVPKVIKDELGGLREQKTSAFESFRLTTEPEKLEKIVDFSKGMAAVEHRERSHFIAKELVNFNQGAAALREEITGEERDLQYLVSQEANLESVSMSWAVPSMRVLLKSQYIPLVEREIALLTRANAFLGRIVSSGEALKEALVSTFFGNRYGYLQFCRGVFCVDDQRSARTHTEKNVGGALMLLAEKYRKGLAKVRESVPSVGLDKAVVLGIEGVREKMSELWRGEGEERFMVLPSSYTIDEALELCDYKLKMIEGEPRDGKSKNSLILIYLSEMDFGRIRNSPIMLEKYHRAILSNIFIDIDGVTVFNNRQSIFEACVKETFGRSNERISKQLVRDLLAA